MKKLFSWNWQLKPPTTLLLLETADSETDRVVTPWRGGGGWNPYPGAPHSTGLLMVGRSQYQGLLFCLSIIYNRPPSRPHHIAFYDTRVPFYWTSAQKQSTFLPLSGTDAVFWKFTPIYLTPHWYVMLKCCMLNSAKQARTIMKHARSGFVTVAYQRFRSIM